MRKMTIAAFGAALSLSTAQGALAQVDDALLDRLKAVLATQQIQIDWEGADVYDNADGEEVTGLSNVRVKAADTEFVLPVIELGGVETTDIGWKVGSLVVPSYSFAENDRNLYMNGISIDGVLVPSAGNKLPYGGMTMYEAASISSILFTIKGAEVIKVDDFHMTITPPDGGSPLEFSAATEAMSIDFTTMPDQQARGVLEQLGYLKMEGFFEAAGSWEPESGTMALTQYDLTVNDAGTLGIALTLGGYTPSFIEQLQKMQEQLMANPAGDNSAAGLAMLGLMQQLSFNSAQISFYDASLTTRVLEFVAKMQGVQPADIANQAKGVVPFLMMQLNNPELTNMVTQAVTKFLDDPQNIVISAEPAQPVPFAVIMAGAMSAPQMLPQQLGVRVTANE